MQRQRLFRRWQLHAAITLVTLLILTTITSAQEEATPMPDATQESAASTAIVSVETGDLEGLVTDSYRYFLGIPYAAPPKGELRWKSPQPAAAWDGVRDATQPGSICPQAAEVFADVSSVEEDCLFLNVMTPLETSADALKPVMVWIHGGGGTNGAGSFFDAQRLVTAEDVIVVTINYRLGVFGAFAYPGLEGSGTFGLQDQQAALQWVQRNIASFGGDPQNVTLFGESYGAFATTAQLVSPLSEGLFHRAIIQSGLGLLDYPAGMLMPGTEAIPSMWLSVEEGEGLGQIIAEQLGCTDLACLQALPVEALLPVSSVFSRFVYGNDVLPEDPVQALRNGNFHDVPVISGGTRDEARLFVGLFFDLAGQPVTEETYSQLLTAAFGDLAEQVAAEYPLSDYNSPSLAWATVITDRVWALRTMQQSRLLAAHVPTYAFEFADQDAPPNLPFPPDFPPGAYHNSEVVYQFELAGEPAPLTDAQQQFAAQMNHYWANFARTGDPNSDDLPQWQPFDAAGIPPFVQALAPGDSGIAPVDYAAEHRLDFWEGLGQ
jgi:para-nitrobenzyl esterase